MNKELFFLFYILSVTFSSCTGNVYRSEIPHLLGIGKVVVEGSGHMEEWGGFRGKGYAIEVYTLNTQAAKSFRANKIKSLPEKKGDKTWHKYGWSNTPFDTAYKEILSVTFDYGGRESIEKKADQIKRLLGVPGIFYAFYYDADKYNPRNVAFFVFDTNAAILYIIEASI